MQLEAFQKKLEIFVPFLEADLTELVGGRGRFRIRCRFGAVAHESGNSASQH